MASFDYPQTRVPGPVLRLSMLLCLGLMAIYWVRLVELGNYSLEANHIGLVMVVLATTLSVYGAPAARKVVAYCAPWLFAYALYLILLLAAVYETPGFTLWVRQLAFAVGFVAIACFFYVASDVSGSLRRGGLCGILLFVLLTEYSARQIDKSLAGAIFDFVASGNFHAVIFRFFRPVFNSLAQSSDLAFRASVTNSIAVSLLVLAICFRVGSTTRRIDIAGTCIFVAVLFLCLLMNARSVVLAGVLGMMLASAVGLATTRGVSLAALLWWCVLTMAAGVLALVVASRGTAVLESVSDAFLFADSSTESRLSQYRWAFDLIEGRLLFGHGYVVTDSGHPVHNLFLSAWVHTGFFGFALVTFFYLALAYTWVRWLYRLLTIPGYWVLHARPEWVAVLPVLPMVRMWLSGAGGHPAFGEWVALAVFVGVIMHNDLRRRYGTQLMPARPMAVRKTCLGAMTELR